MYDAVIAGGGPAGLQCARLLSRTGLSVLLLEKSLVPGEPNYSTAGTPFTTIQQFDIPKVSITDFFNTLRVVTPHHEASWSSDTILGYVLDFAKLKTSIANELDTDHVTILYGANVTGVDVTGDKRITRLYYTYHEKQYLAEGKYYIDATAASGILATSVGIRKKQPSKPSVGIEKIIRAQLPPYFHHAIIVYMGDCFIPNGYGWVFCFGKDMYKIGVAVYDMNPKTAQQPLIKYLMNLIDTLNIHDFTEIEQHGKTTYITGGMAHNTWENGIAIGDTGSCINPLFGEGIRHALYSGQLAAECIQSSNHSLKLYDKKLAQHRKNRWALSRIFATLLYHIFTDSMRDSFVTYMEKLSVDDIMDIAFEFQYKKLFKIFA